MGKHIRSHSEKQQQQHHHQQQNNNNIDSNGVEYAVNHKSKSNSEEINSSITHSSSGQGGIIRRSKALYVSSTMPLKSQVQSQSDNFNGSSITANNTVTGIYNYDTTNSYNWDEVSSNAKNNFMSLDRHMNLPNYCQPQSPQATPPYKTQSLGPNAVPPYSTGSLGRNTVHSSNQYSVNSVPINIAQNNTNITNSQVCVSPKVIATSPNIIATSPNILATSPNIIATSPNILATSPNIITASPSYIVINSPNMEQSPVLSPTHNYNIVENSNGRRLSNPTRPGSIHIGGNYTIVEDNVGRRISNPPPPNYSIVEDNVGRRISNPPPPNYSIVEDNNGRRLSNPAKPGAIQISNGNLYLQNTYPSSTNLYGSPTPSSPVSSPSQNIMYSLPRNFSSSQSIPLSQSPTAQNIGGVQMFQKSQNPPNQRYSLPVMNNSMIKTTFLTKSNTVDYRSNNNSPMRHSSQHKINPIRHSSQHNTLSLSENNTVRSTGNFGGLSINGQEYRSSKSSSNVSSSPLMEATLNGTTRSRAKSNSFSVKIPERKDSTCIVGSLNSSSSSFMLDNSKSNSYRNVNPVANPSPSSVSNSSSQGSGKIHDYSHNNKILPDNINDPDTPKSEAPSISENIISQPIDIPASNRGSDSDTDSDSSFSSYRSSNYVMSVTQGTQTESNYAEIHPRPPPYEHSFMDQDSYDMDNDHDLIFDLEHTTSIPRSNSDEKEIVEGMPILFNSRRRSRERPLFDRESINNDTLTSSTAFSNLLDSYTKILNSFETEAKRKDGSNREGDPTVTGSMPSVENNVQRKESNKSKRNSGTLFGVDVEVEKEILKKRSTLRSKDRAVADEILRKISISNAKSTVKPDAPTVNNNNKPLVKKSSTHKSSKTVDTDVVMRENTLNQNDLSLSSATSPKNNLEEKTVIIESQGVQNVVSETEPVLVQSVDVLLSDRSEEMQKHSVLEKPKRIGEDVSFGNEKDDIDIGLDIFDRFYEECLKRIDDTEETEGTPQQNTTLKNKKSKENMLSLGRSNSIYEFDEELKDNFLSGLLFSNTRSSPSLENIKNFLQGDSLSEELFDGKKEKNEIEAEEAILQPTVVPKPKKPEMRPPLVQNHVKKESTPVVVEPVEPVALPSPELQKKQSPKQEQVQVSKEKDSGVQKQKSVSSSKETTTTEITKVPVVEKNSPKQGVSQIEPNNQTHPLPPVPVEQKKEVGTQVEIIEHKRKDDMNVGKVEIIENVENINNVEKVEKVENIKNVENVENVENIKNVEKVENLSSKDTQKSETKESESKESESKESESKESETKDKENKTNKDSEAKEEAVSKEGDNKKDGSISSSDSIKKIEVILKKNSDRGNRIILPQSISDINKENKNEEPFIPNKSEVKQLIDRGLSNSSSHNLDNTQFFWSSDVQANTEVHPSEIFNHSNSVPEKLLGTIPSRKKSFAESAYVITRDNISNDINGKPVIDPKNYIRYRRSRVIWEHYNNSYLQHRMMSWSSNAIIRSKTIGSCYIKPQHSVSVSASSNVNIPIRSHTTEAKTKPPTKGPVTNYYEFLTPSIEALKEDNEMLTKVVNDMIKRKESDPKTPELEELSVKKDEQDAVSEKKDTPEIVVNVVSDEEKQQQEQAKPFEEGKLQPKKVQINEDNNQVVSSSNEDEVITKYIPNDSSLSYSKTIYEYTADEDLEKIVEENSKAKRSGWAIWWSNYASQEDANNRLKEQKQMNEDSNKNLLRKIRHFGNKSKKNKKQKKKRNKDNDNKSSTSVTPVTPVTPITPITSSSSRSSSEKSKKRESLPVSKRHSSISHRGSKSQKKKQQEKKEEEKEEEIPYTQTLTPSPLLSPQILPVKSKKKDKKSKSNLNRNSVIVDSTVANDKVKSESNEDDVGYSSDSSFSSISTVSSISSFSSVSINEQLQLGSQTDLLPLANTSSNSNREIFQDESSEFSDFASSPGSPLFSSVKKEFPSPKEFIPVEDIQSPSIQESLPEDLILPPTSTTEQNPEEIFSENDLLAPDERDLMLSSSPQDILNTTNNQIYDLANFMSTPSSGVSSAQSLFNPPSSVSSSQITSTFELDNEKFNAISRELQKRMESIYLLQLSLQQQFEQISVQLQEHQRTNDTLLQEEMEAIKQENEWRKNCIQQQKIIKQKQLELQDKQRKLQMEQEILQQKQLQQQEIHRQEQQLQLQELQLSQLKLQLQLQEQIKEQLQRQQQLQPMVTEVSSSYYDAMSSPKPGLYTSNPFDQEINEMFGQSSSNYTSFNDIHKMEEDQVIPDLSKERIDINDLIEANYDSEDSFTNNSDYYYSDITSNSDFTDTTYDSTGSEYSFMNNTYNDRLHIYKPEDDLPYARFNPLVEKALYQLSWNKLSYSKRSLHQQVVIRNLMIYYFTLNMEGSGRSRKSSMRRHVPRIKGVGRKRSRTK
ncbi:hypothetical protein PIROE2DRAFT_61784 [Piromyces sp. E2]|nr:hypothetical protein PIROE2DRAFT_61784 [Piromyces sp. E2]|eukprot:OUM62599.1 hypothetical protein PIROE2DRAFT_61784 [Piromyces sp. E2]